MSDPLIPGELPLYGFTVNFVPYLIPDSVIEFDVKADTDINSHPVELGGFAAYNRVQQSVRIRTSLACQGQRMSRATFLARLTQLRNILTMTTQSLVTLRAAVHTAARAAPDCRRPAWCATAGSRSRATAASSL